MRGAMRAILCLLALLGVAREGVTQAPDGYYFGQPADLPASLRESYEGFTIEVERTWSNDAERDVLLLSERLFPSEELIEAEAAEFLTRRSANSKWPEHFANARAFEGERWWWHEWGTVLLPYALTGSAVEHFVESMRALTQTEPHAREGEVPQHRGSFTYRARVMRLGGGFGVEMEARWAYACGSLCGLWFTEERRLTFDAEGRLLSVDGDGFPSYMVS